MDGPRARKEWGMTLLLLERLRGDDFNFSIGFLHSPAAVRRSLMKSPFVRHVAAALRFGAITEGIIQEFVSSIMAEFTNGLRLQNDLALAALAVALELRPTEFAEEYLHDLARLDLAEMRTSINVARECLKSRCSVPKHQAKSFVFPSNEKPPSRPLVSRQRRWGDGLPPRSVSRYPECAGAL